MNDLMRGKMTRRDGTIPLWGEIIAGGCVSDYFSGVEVCCACNSPCTGNFSVEQIDLSSSEGMDGNVSNSHPIDCVVFFQFG